MLYIFFDFATRLTSVSIYLESPFQFEFGDDIFGNQYRSLAIAEWVSWQYSGDLHPEIATSVGATISSMLRMIVVSVLAVTFSKSLTRRSIRLGTINSEAWAWIIIFVFGATAIHYVFAVMQSGSFSSLGPTCNLLSIQGDIEVPAVFILLQVLSFAAIAPITEEINNRGFLVNALSGLRNVLPAAVISSTMFAFLHGDLGLMWLYYFSCGLVLFIARLRFGGILVPIAMHAALNGSIVLDAIFRC